MAPISIQELHLFHRIDREVFSCLVLKFGRDPTESLLVIALWLWLENTGYPNVMTKVVSLSDTLVNVLANEAVACLKCLEAENPILLPKCGSLPLTTTLVERQISLQIFNKKRFTAIAGIKSILNNICARIFTDILQMVLNNNTNTNNSIASTSRSTNSYRTFIPHRLFGSLDEPPMTVNLDLSDERIWKGRKRPSDDVSDDDKTVFLTFSRGFYVSEEEVRYLFNSAYGHYCIKSLVMEELDVNDHSLFAIMILNTVATVDQILKGKRIAKLKINGKHVWVRKYKRRD